MPTDGRKLPRRGQFTNIQQAASHAVAFGVDGFVVATVPAPIAYTANAGDKDEGGADLTPGEALFLTAEVAAAQPDPNVTPPAATAIMPAAYYRSGKVGILAVWPGTAQAVTFEVWVRTGLTATGLPKWALVDVNGEADPAKATEYIADCCGRDAYVRVLTGADAGHHVQFAMGVV